MKRWIASALARLAMTPGGGHRAYLFTV